MNDEGAVNAALFLEVTGQAEAELNGALTWLLGVSETAARRFRAVLPHELSALCQSVAARLQGSTPGGLGRLPAPDAAASLHFSRPVFQHRFSTVAKRRRSSSAGVWRVFYALADRDGDGRADTISVLSVRHGAAAPFPPISQQNETAADPPQE